MQDSEVRYVKRLVLEMLKLCQHQDALPMFMGLGLALAFFYEEATGKESKNLKPLELMQWVIDMPAAPKRGRLVC